MRYVLDTNVIFEFVRKRPSTIVVTALDVTVILLWAEVVVRLDRSGHPIAAMDSLIAASALAHGCTLVTRNVEHFKNTGVALFDPWASPTS